MKQILLLFIFAFPSLFVFGQEISSGLSVSPILLVPVGSNAELYKPGIGANLEGLLSLGKTDIFAIGLDLGYAFVPLELDQPYFSTSTNLSMIDLGLGARASLPISQRFSLTGKANLAGYSAFVRGQSSGNDLGLKFSVGGGLGLLLNNTMLVHTDISYTSFLNLHDSVSISLGLISRLSGTGSNVIPKKDFVPEHPGQLPGGGNIQFMDAELSRVFPVLYKYYDTHPIGQATIVNEGNETIEDIKIRLTLAQHMDASKVSAEIDRLESGEERTVDIYALFNDTILSITEGGKLASELTAEYRVRGRSAVESTTLTLETWDRNALQWDDDRKIASFVTARDEEIQKTSRNVASIVRDEGLSGFNSEFQLAIAMLSVMDAFGCAYVIDPSSSYATLSSDNSAVDSVQFPRQTLQYRAGDCDDLSSTYNALLESVGIETAFITVPGHIFSAFKLNMTSAEAERTFSRFHDLIVRPDGSIWVPVETTALRNGFLDAWALGGKQWREHDISGRAGFLPVRDAWRVFEPVAFSISSINLVEPNSEEIGFLFNSELEDFISQEISSRERLLLAKIDRNPDDRVSMNSLGVLYAKFGRIGEARSWFEKATPKASAYLNLGNIHYLGDQLDQAEMAYQEALETKPEYPAALLGLARIAHRQEDYGKAAEYYDRMSDVAPDLAARFSYLADYDEAGVSPIGRASAMEWMSQTVMWGEE